MEHPLIESGKLRDLSWLFGFIDRASSPHELDALFHLTALTTAYPAFHPQLTSIVVALAERYGELEDRRTAWTDFPEREKDRTLLWFVFAALHLCESEAELDNVKDLIKRIVPTNHPEMGDLIKEIKVTRGQIRAN